MSALSNGISVIMCCYNSTQKLLPTLTHLAKQNINGFQAELIVVDNNSIDETLNFSSKIWADLGEPFELVGIHEFQQGLSYARISGVKRAKFEYIVFCDDDNWLDSEYLCQSFQLLNNHKTVGAFGGLSEAISDSKFPDWFAEVKGAYAITDMKLKNGKLPKNNYLTGAGLVTRKSLILCMFKDVPSLLKDRKGTELSSGGDTEICLRLILMGYDLHFSDLLKFQHFIPGNRLTKEYCNKLFAGFKEMKDIIEYYRSMIHIKNSSKIIKIKLFATILLKLPFTFNNIVSRWSLKRDLLTFYIITGVNFLPLPPNWKDLRTAFYIQK